MFPELTVRDCQHRQSRRHVFWIVYAASSHPRLTGAYLRPSVAGLAVFPGTASTRHSILLLPVLKIIKKKVTNCRLLKKRSPS